MGVVNSWEGRGSRWIVCRWLTRVLSRVISVHVSGYRTHSRDGVTLDELAVNRRVEVALERLAALHCTWLQVLRRGEGGNEGDERNEIRISVYVQPALSTALASFSSWMSKSGAQPEASSSVHGFVCSDIGSQPSERLSRSRPGKVK